MAKSGSAALALALLLLGTLLQGGSAASRDPCKALSDALSSDLALPTQALACLSSFPYNATIARQITKSLIRLFNLHVYKDISKNSPTPSLPLQVDVVKGLTKIMKTEYRNDLEFNRAVYQLINSLNDGHTTYFPYCYAGEQLKALSAFPLVYLKENGSQIIRVSPAASIYFPRITSATERATGYKVATYNAAEVVKINGVDALTYAYKAAETLGSYKDVNARINDFFSHYDSSGNVAYGRFASKSMIELDNVNSLNLTVKRFGRSPEVINVPFFVYGTVYFGDGPEYFATFCKPSTSSLRKKRETKPQRQPSRRWSMATMLRPQSSPKVRLADLQRAAKTAPEKLGQPLRPVRAQAAQEPKVVYTGSVQQAWLLGDAKTGVLPLIDFGKDSPPSTWQAEIFTAITKLKQAGAKRLIIDLQGNMGGDAGMATTLVNYLFPQYTGVEYPSQFLASPFAQRIFKATLQRLERSAETLIADSYLYSWFGLTATTDGRPPFFSSDGFFYPLKRQTLGGVQGNYSSLFAFLERNSSPYGLLAPNELLKPLADKRPEFPAKDILLLSNGQCYSACAKFMYAMSELPRVRTVVVGGKPGVPMAYAAGLASFTYTLDSLVYYDIPYAGLERHPEAPKALPVQAYVGYVPALSYCRANKTTPADFVFKPATIHIQFDITTVLDSLALWDQVATYF